ncbi:MAG: RIP metalloprotease RseP [Gemmatimonadota bacterium]|nr:RIP metalloprotease RseP [Gemmatimonadota bacterium]
MEFLETIFYFILVLGVLVFVHEFGHFIVAKRSGIRVEQFSLGFPPKAFGITVGETEYCISWLPIGGYVKVAGMSDFGSADVRQAPWEFQSKPRGIQMAVFVAGPVMNFLLGFLLIFGLRFALGDYVLQTTKVGRIEATSPFYAAGLRTDDRILAVSGTPVADWGGLIDAYSAGDGGDVVLEVARGDEVVSLVATPDPGQALDFDPFLPSTAGSVMPGYPAARGGMEPGDRVLAIEGESVSGWDEMRKKISARPGLETEIRWLRGRDEMAARIVPQPQQGGGRTIGVIGIGPSYEPSARVPVTITTAIERSGRDLVGYTTLIFTLIKRIIMGEVSGGMIAGPVGIAQMAGSKAREGWEALLDFMAMLSINLAVLNLLPIPALDGGHLMILSVEAISRRSLSARQKERIQQVGFVFLLGLMVYVTFGDIGRIWGLFY